MSHQSLQPPQVLHVVRPAHRDGAAHGRFSDGLAQGPGGCSLIDAQKRSVKDAQPTTRGCLVRISRLAFVRAMVS